jgi:hypothetical protein
MKLQSVIIAFALGASLLPIVACHKSQSNPNGNAKNPDTSPVVSVDRFSQSAGTLQVRTASNGLPGPNVPVNFDNAPFITMGLTPSGGKVSYYNFDIRSIAPAPIYVLFKQGQTQQIPGQLNIIDVLPGESGYNDFWQINMVTVPDDYVANTITSYDEIVQKGYQIQKTNTLVNCPVVPKGSTASLRYNNGDTALSRGWYEDQVVYYFNFSEKALQVNGSGQVPAPIIYVSFKINPNQQGGGPQSGFKTETGTSQTHNVISVIPTDAAYSPLWSVAVYDNNAFDSVINLSTASMAPILVPNAGTVNCPVVAIH